MNPNQVSSCQQFRMHWQNPPWILPAFLLFSVIATVIASSVFYAPHFDELIVPFTGWSGLSIYMFTLMGVIMAMFTPYRKAIYDIAGMLALIAVFGLFDTYDHTWGSRACREDYGNPYLMYHPLRPLINIVLPLFWMTLLISPAMKRWVKSGDQPVPGK